MALSFKENYIASKHFQLDFGLSSNPLGPSPQVKQALLQVLSDGEPLSPYPTSGYPKLTEAIASFYQISPNEIILGAGLDGLIFDIINCALGAGDELILPAITFRNAIYAANAKGAVVTQVPMKSNFAVDFDRLIEAINKRTKIIFLCNPNNPTGIYEPLVFIRRLLESTDSLVVLDEANIEFSGGSGLALVKEFSHLIVLRTFSKAYGLAGARVGFGVSHSSIFNKIVLSRPPFFISTLSEIATCHAILDQQYLLNTVHAAAQERNFLEKELAILGFTIIPSQSNTLLCRVPEKFSSASGLIEQLNQYDCHVVNGTYFNLEDRYVRIAPRLHEANEQLLAIFKRIFGD